MGKKTLGIEKNNKRIDDGTQLMDELFDAAFEYKELKLWKELWDDQIFAVRCRDGTTLYACVMGKNGEYTAIAFYIGAEGLDTMRNMRDSAAFLFLDASERLEIMLCQDCLSCSFDSMDALRPTEKAQLRNYCKRKGRKLRGANACPHLERYLPNHVPWNIREEQDKQHLLEGLRAACTVAKALQERGVEAETLGLFGNPELEGSCPLLVAEDEGWSWQKTELPEEPESFYESPTLTELEAKRLKQRKSRGSWAMGVFLMPRPVVGGGEAAYEPGDEEPYNAPFYPFMLCAIDITSGMSVFHELTSEEGSFRGLMQGVVKAIGKHGCPATIQVQDERTEAFCKAWTGQLGIRLQFQDEIPALEDFKEKVLLFAEKDEGEAEAEILQEISEAMDDPEYLPGLEDEDLMMLCMLAEQVSVPEQFKSKVMKEARRRGLI